jgi:hypothetical protein
MVIDIGVQGIAVILSTLFSVGALVSVLRNFSYMVKKDDLDGIREELRIIKHELCVCEEHRKTYYEENIALMRNLLGRA